MSELPESERNRLRNEVRRLRLAASDMEQVAIAAQTLAEVRLNEAAERVMHTGIVVTYLRPFYNAGIGTLDIDEWAPTDPDAARLHNALLKLRSKVYGHTDESPWRDVEDTSELLGLAGGPTFAESSVSLSAEGIAQIGATAERLARSFGAMADEREFELGRPRPESWPNET